MDHRLPAGLYIVATPIGNLGDITLRALDTLKGCDTIFCEDTRVSKKLLSHFHIQKPLDTYHDHNGAHKRPKIFEAIAAGQAVALISDAGMPLISDPGFKLVRECQDNGFLVDCIPGPSAVISGLVLSGLPTNQFFFGGFFDAKKAESYVDYMASIIFFESNHRLLKTLEILSKLFGDRECSVVREITKLHQESRRGTASQLLDIFTAYPSIKGEIVIVISPAQECEKLIEDFDDILKDYLAHMSVKDASALVSKHFHVNKKDAYQRALHFQKEN